ncbi:ferredoxin [Streptomyces sp. NPDC002734]|uniref:ferredoxin n=1 Tax=Streptomyces sp. NPDC002734 TaxID=3154426 RepID=UPI003321B715
MRVTVDMNLCQNHGQCVFAAPEIFAFDDDENLVHREHPDEAERGQAERAAALCPVRAITVVPAPSPVAP